MMMLAKERLALWRQRIAEWEERVDLLRRPPAPPFDWTQVNAERAFTVFCTCSADRPLSSPCPFHGVPAIPMPLPGDRTDLGRVVFRAVDRSEAGYSVRLETRDR